MRAQAFRAFGRAGVRSELSQSTSSLRANGTCGKHSQEKHECALKCSLVGPSVDQSVSKAGASGTWAYRFGAGTTGRSALLPYWRRGRTEQSRALCCALDMKVGLENMIATVSTDNATGDSQDNDGPIRVLLRLAEAGRVSRSGDGSVHVRVPVGDRHEVYGIRSGAFRDWLIGGYFGERGEPPAPWMIARVVGLLEARARFDGDTPSVFVRVAPAGDTRGRCSFLDLGDGTGAAIKISAEGWEITERPDIQFKRPAGMLALPVPVRGGSIELLRPYVNVDDAGFRLVIAWLTSALLPVGPYPILSLHGEQGTAKSTLARMLRLLIDPQACALLAEPASNRDLMVTARNGWLLAYDNITDIPGWLSDSLCRLVFGAGFSGRALYTDDERIVLQAQRPVILNGIEDFVRKSDLIDRTVIVQMRSISTKRRRHEEELWASFRADQPLILGSVLDAVAHGLRELPGVKLERMPRMADFAGGALPSAAGSAGDPMRFCPLMRRTGSRRPRDRSMARRWGHSC